MERGKCKVWSVVCKVERVKCSVEWKVESVSVERKVCTVWSGKWTVQVWSVKCKV